MDLLGKLPAILRIQLDLAFRQHEAHAGVLRRHCEVLGQLGKRVGLGLACVLEHSFDRNARVKPDLARAKPFRSVWVRQNLKGEQHKKHRRYTSAAA